MSGDAFTSDQLQAIDPAFSVWAAASAGTGKTHVLINRLLRLLLAGAAPNRILCLTYTKAAANEMKSRVQRQLASWIDADDDALAQDLTRLLANPPGEEEMRRARQLFAQVLDQPGGLPIQTIHSFCQSLLARFPAEAGVPPQAKVMDERASQDMLRTVRDAQLDEIRRDRRPDLRAALDLAVAVSSEGTITDALGQLIGRRRDLLSWLDQPGQLIDLLRDHLAIRAGDSERDIIRQAVANDRLNYPGLQRLLRAILASSAKKALEKAPDLQAWLSADEPGRIELWSGYSAVFLTEGGEARKNLITKEIRAKLPEADDLLADEAARIQHVEARRNACRVFAQTEALIILGFDLLARYRQAKQRAALLDYDDLILAARDLVTRAEDAAWVLFKLDGGLDHLLIDEAQDTSPEQWQIARALCDEFMAGLGAQSARARSLFVVGDHKQSIYSFQGAAPEEFEVNRRYFAERISAAGRQFRTVSLDLSFRSAPMILALVNKTFVAESARHAVGGDFPLHRPKRTHLPGRVEFWSALPPVKKEKEAAWSLPVRQGQERGQLDQLADAVARRVKELIGTPCYTHGRPFQPGDVMVLLRRRGELAAALIAAFLRAGLPVAGADRLKLLDQIGVQDLLSLGRFLLQPKDDLALAEVMTSPLGGLSDDDLIALAPQRSGSMWAELKMRAGETPAWADLLARLTEWRRRCDQVSPYQFFAELLGREGRRRALLARLPGEAEDALDEFLDLALRYQLDHPPSLQHFLHWLALGESEVKRDLDQGRNEIRVMTVHAAKGLQAPLVILPDCFAGPARKQPLLWHQSPTAAVALPLWPALKDNYDPLCRQAEEYRAAAEAAESHRLLYVALTRAEEYLLVCGAAPARGGPAPHWHELVAAGITLMDQAEQAPHPQLDGVMVTRLADALSARPNSLAPDSLVTPPKPPLVSESPRVPQPVPNLPALPLWAVTPPAEEPVPPRPLAPSRPSDAESAGQAPFQASEGNQFRRGLAVHRLLQFLPELAPARRETAAARFLQAQAQAFSPLERSAMIAQVIAILDHPDYAPLFGPSSLAEVPVAGLISAQAAAISGQIDRILVRDDEIWLVDYKSNRQMPAHAAAIPQSYRRQMALYRAAVTQIYPHQRIRCGLLWTEGPRLDWLDGLIDELT